MKLKKFASLLLAMAMVLALAVPAFASDYSYSDKNSQAVTMKGATTVPKVQVSLPSGAALTNSFLLNPYKVGYTVTIAGTETTVAADAALGTSSAPGPQVISPILSIANNTNCKMQVDVTVTTTLNGNLKLMTADFADGAQATDTKNNAFLYVNMMYDQAAAATSSTADFNTTVLNAVDQTNKKTESIILKAGDVKKTNYIVQPAAPSTGPNFIWVQFGGKMAEGPTTPWTDKDTANVAFAFTFTPNQNAAYASS